MKPNNYADGGRATTRAARALLEHAPRVAEQTTARQFSLSPGLDARYGPEGRAECSRDTIRHIEYLAQSVESESTALFVDYVGWAKVLRERLPVPGVDLAVNLACLEEVLANELPLEFVQLARAPLGAARESVGAVPNEIASYLQPGFDLASLARDYLDALLDGDRRRASRLVLDAVESGAEVRRVYLDVFQRSQYEIGRLWQTNRITVAQEHFCTAATQLVMSQLYERIFSTKKRGLTMVATCATSDLHELGIRMVSDFFEMDGWDTFYLGANTPVESVVRTVVDRKADLLAVSVTITTHLPHVRDLIAAIGAEPECASTRVLVGGYPFALDPDLWRRIGAHGSATDALSAVTAAERLVQAGAP